MLNPLTISLPIQLALGAAVVAVVAGVIVLNKPDVVQTPSEEPTSKVISIDEPEPSATNLKSEPVEPAPNATENVVAGGSNNTATTSLEPTSPAASEQTKAILPESSSTAGNKDTSPEQTASVSSAPVEDVSPKPVEAVSSQVVEQTPEQKAEAEKGLDTAPRVETGPVFDLVRVDDSGSAVIAGTADPGAKIQVTLDNTALDTITADQSGAFVSLVQIPQGEQAQTVGLRQLLANKQVVTSTQTVLIVPPPVKTEPIAPTVVLAGRSGPEVLQSAINTPDAQSLSFPLSLEAISYDQGGDVVLAGKADGQQFVRVYVDNTAVKTQPVLDDGNWQVVLPEISQGVYTLRVDEISETGIVSGRVESPFKRVAAGEVKPENGGSIVTVQPGHTLWALAHENYGDGVKYVQILDANRSLIRDADLIYPGQVFDIPK